MPRTAVAVVSFLTLLALAAPLAAHAAEAPHPFTARDLWVMDRISDPQPDPQGNRIAFSVRVTDFATNGAKNDLWLVNADGSGLRQLTADAKRNSDPRWAPDGKSLFFLSTRSGSSQIWRLPLDGGRPSQVTDLPLDASALKVSPDGSLLAFSLEVFPDCADLACSKKRVDDAAAAQATGRVYDRMFTRHWDTWQDGRRNHLFVIPASGGTPIDLSRGMDADVPSKPFGGAEEFAFTPDGKAVVFSARIAGQTESWSTNFDLYRVPVDGSAAPQNLTASNLAWDTQPSFSPDGKTLAYMAMVRPGFEADRFHIRLRDLSTGAEKELAAAWDRTPAELVWSRDGKTIYASANDLGRSPLFAIDVATGAARKLTAEGSVHSPVLLGERGDRIVFGRDTFRSPVELFTIHPDGSGLTQITRINEAKVAAAQMTQPEQFSFVGSHGDTVYGWVAKPVGWVAGQKAPIAFLIHGGPQGSFEENFHYRWNPQVYAGAGYATIMIDFHGSTGYGQAFTDAISKDWGGGPLEDLQKGLAAALAKYPWLDGDRACALGASYGGYMINWIAGRWPDGFKCLVNHDGLFDQRAMYYTTEELWFPEWEQGGPYYENPEAHEKWNPANYVANWKTPMLVAQGGLDYRVPEGQGIATFTALQRRGIPSRFLYLPDENHWVLHAANSLLWHETVLGWLDRWLKTKN
ncbi:MAG TPA: S9 family peptidase [Thermoanaerobaculia bacterium]|jgi:dipeptidyl aminopeptidase/acylaminoacyl peptidase|nr:S9 family peptidase [Thermoanaerobaculia bacterium]